MPIEVYYRVKKGDSNSFSESKIKVKNFSGICFSLFLMDLVALVSFSLGSPKQERNNA